MLQLQHCCSVLVAFRGSWRLSLQWQSLVLGPRAWLRTRCLTARADGGLYRPALGDELLDFEGEEELLEKMQACHAFRRFIGSPALARTVTDCLEAGGLVDSGVRVFEHNPGPGILTRTLLDAGAQVVALESDKTLLPDLQALRNNLNGQLEVIYCDFFKMDPSSLGFIKPPIMKSEKLFENLGMSRVPWTADVPVKVVGIFSQNNERIVLWKYVYNLYDQSSIFRYGRIELNMFISEKEYKKLVAKPGNTKRYKTLSVLVQIACDIQLLHMEPWSSFLTSRCGKLSIPKSVHVPNDHLCLVRVTPRRNLFTECLSAAHSDTFILMVKHCLTKSKAKLLDKLNSLSPGNGQSLLEQLEIPDDVLTGSLSPEDYLRLFKAMEHSIDFNQSWIFDEVL